jgi:hypothetical protein
MGKSSVTRVFFFGLFFALANIVAGQSWNFIKEKDGIRIYTRNEPNSSLKSFMGVADLHTNMAKINEYLGNAKKLDWWNKSVSEVKVLAFDPGKMIRYYIRYDVPWPFSDRDLVVETKITNDAATGKEVLFALPLPDLVPPKPDAVRIRKYWQRWTVQPMPNGIVHVILEGYVDPGGNVPAWLYNMAITDTPLKVIREIKSRVEGSPSESN